MIAVIIRHSVVVAVSFKVWVKTKQHEHVTEPAYLEEICFKDERTRKMCKAWLCLQSPRALRADILFPSCEFDCRLNIATSK